MSCCGMPSIKDERTLAMEAARAEGIKSAGRKFYVVQIVAELGKYTWCYPEDPKLITKEYYHVSTKVL